MRSVNSPNRMISASGSKDFGNFIKPQYRGRSVANVAPTIANMLAVNFGSTTFRKGLVAEHDSAIEHVLLFVVDALGNNVLSSDGQVSREFDSTFPQRRVKRSLITSVFPSTTATALTSMFTGLTPSEHGILGYTLFLKEFGSVFNMISLSPVNDQERGRMFDLGLTMDRLLPQRKLTEALSESGIKSRLLIRYALRGSGISTMLYRDSELIPYLDLPDMFHSLANILKGDKGGLTIIYWDGLDGMSHHYGPFSKEVEYELLLFIRSMNSFFLRKVPKRSTEGAFVMLTSDHGQAQTKDQNSYDVESIAWLKDSLLMPPTGEGRCAYLYTRKGVKNFEGNFRKTLGKDFLLISSKRSVSEGLFGQAGASVGHIERIGDHISIARGASKLIFTYNLRERLDTPFVRYGSHGGLTTDEMIVPLVSAPLCKLVA